MDESSYVNLILMQNAIGWQEEEEEEWYGILS
jgi:hypothetical protein